MGLKKTAAWAVLWSLTAAGIAPAKESGPGIDVSADYYGKYIWRGQNLSDDPVFQPAVTLYYDRWSGGVWANMDTTGINDNSGEFTEYDYWIGYTTDLAEGLCLSLGGIYYDFPSGEATQEIYAGLGLDLPLSPAVTLYYDVDEIHGTYVRFSLGHTIEKFRTFGENCRCDLSFGVSLGYAGSAYNRDYWGVDEDALNDLTFSVSMPTCFTGEWTLTPSVNYVMLVSDDICESDVYDTASDYFFAGIGLSKSF